MPQTFKQTIARALDGKGRYGSITVKVIIALVIFSTASFALSTVESLSDANEAVFSLIEVVSIGIFTLEYVLRCWTADDMCAYIMTPIAIIDLCSVLPSWIDAVVPGDQFPAFNFLRMLRIFKVSIYACRHLHTRIIYTNCVYCMSCSNPSLIVLLFLLAYSCLSSTHAHIRNTLVFKRFQKRGRRGESLPRLVERQQVPDIGCIVCWRRSLVSYSFNVVLLGER